MSNEDLAQTSAWLYRLSDGLSDACSDARAAMSGDITYLGFDFSFLFPSIAGKETLDPVNPRHRFDLASRYIYENINLYRPEIYGYKLVLNDFCLLKLLYHQSSRLMMIESIIRSPDIYQSLKNALPSSANTNGDKPTADVYAEYIGELIDEMHQSDERVETFRQHLKSKTIVGIGDIFDSDLIRRSWSDETSFNSAMSVIDSFRHPSQEMMDPADLRFLKTIDALSLVSTKHIVNHFPGRYRYLGWTRGKGFFGPDANKYYRIVLSPFFRLVTLRQTPDSDNLLRSALIALEDRKEQAKLYHNRAFSLYRSGHSELSPIFVDGINMARDDYLEHLRGGTIAMSNSKRRRLSESLSGTTKDAREALSEASVVYKKSVMTLSELAKDFLDDDLLSRYELHHSPRMARIFKNLKMGD